MSSAVNDRLVVKDRLVVCMLLHKSVVYDSRVRREAVALTASGHHVTVLELARTDEALPGFARRSVLPPAWMRRLIPFNGYRVAFLARFVAAIVRLRPDVVHAHDAAMLLPGLLGARLTGARLVYDSHEFATGVPYRDGAWERFVRAVERLAVPRCDAVVTVTGGIADRLQDLYGLPERPTVVRNVCELERPMGEPRPHELRSRLGIGAAPLVLHQGAPAPGRGCEALVRAMAHLPDAHLLFLGSGEADFEERLRAVATEVGIRERMHALPSVPLTELLEHSREADVGVTLLEDSCENHRLALPNKLFEYLAAGVPVLASDLPELRHIVAGYGVGWTVDPGDQDSVVQGLRVAVEQRGDPALLERVRRADAESSWERESIRLSDLYATLAAR